MSSTDGDGVVAEGIMKIAFVIGVIVLVVVSLGLHGRSAVPPCQTVVIHPMLHAEVDAQESDEINRFVSGISFKCPDGYRLVDAKHLFREHMTYKDILNADAQSECRK